MSIKNELKSVRVGVKFHFFHRVPSLLLGITAQLIVINFSSLILIFKLYEVRVRIRFTVKGLSRMLVRCWLTVLDFLSTQQGQLYSIDPPPIDPRPQTLDPRPQTLDPRLSLQIYIQRFSTFKQQHVLGRLPNLLTLLSKNSFCYMMIRQLSINFS